MMEKLKGLVLDFNRLLKRHPHVQFIVFGALLSIVGFLPHLGIMRFSTMSVIAYIVIYTVVALGMNILLGFSGLISLGTAGFMGAGALGIGVFMGYGIPFEIAALFTVIIAGGIGALIGVFSLKVDGIYLAIATLFVGEILRQIYTQVAIFGGEGINISAVRFLGFIELNQIRQWNRTYLYIILVAVMVVMMMVMYNIVKSRTGRALMAMSRSDSAAQAMGVSIMKYRLTAFILATVFATIGGILYGIYFQQAPTRAWTLNISLIIIAMVVVGGFKSIYGTFLGAFIIHGIPNLWLKDIFGDVSNIFSGILIILVILFYPNGFVYVWIDIKKAYYRWKLKRDKKEVTANE